MAYQVPKKDHPWRAYANREVEAVKRKKKEHVRSVKLVVSEIVESWENIEVFTYAYGKEGRFRLNELPQAKQAAWLAGLLKKSYEKIQVKTGEGD